MAKELTQEELAKLIAENKRLRKQNLDFKNKGGTEESTIIEEGVKVAKDTFEAKDKRYPKPGGDQDWNRIKSILFKASKQGILNPKYIHYFNNAEVRMKNLPALLTLIKNVAIDLNDKNIVSGKSKLLTLGVRYYVKSIENATFYDTTGDMPNKVQANTVMIPGRIGREEALTLFDTLANWGGGVTGLKAQWVTANSKATEFINDNLLIGSLRSVGNYGQTLGNMALRTLGMREGSFEGGVNLIVGTLMKDAQNASQYYKKDSWNKPFSGYGGKPNIPPEAKYMFDSYEEISYEQIYKKINEALFAIDKVGLPQLKSIQTKINNISVDALEDAEITKKIANVVAYDSSAMQYKEKSKRQRILEKNKKERDSLADEISTIDTTINAEEEKKRMDIENDWITSSADILKENIETNKPKYNDIIKKIKKTMLTYGIRKFPKSIADDVLTKDPKDFAVVMKDALTELNGEVVEKKLLNNNVSIDTATKAKELFLAKDIPFTSVDAIIDFVNSGNTDDNDVLYKLESIAMEYKSDKDHKERQHNIETYLKTGSEQSFNKIDDDQKKRYKALREKIKFTINNVGRYERVMNSKSGKYEIIDNLTGKRAPDKVLSNITMTANYEVNGKPMRELIPELRKSENLKTMNFMRTAIAARHGTDASYGAERAYHIAEEKRTQDNSRWMLQANIVNRRIRKAREEGRDARAIYDETIASMSKDEKDPNYAEGLRETYKGMFSSEPTSLSRSFLKKPEEEIQP